MSNSHQAITRIARINPNDVYTYSSPGLNSLNLLKPWHVWPGLLARSPDNPGGFHWAGKIRRPRDWRLYFVSWTSFSTLMQRQYGLHFANDLFKCTFPNSNDIIMWISLTFAPENPTDSKTHVMAWYWIRDKPLSKPTTIFDSIFAASVGSVCRSHHIDIYKW